MQYIIPKALKTNITESNGSITIKNPHKQGQTIKFLKLFTNFERKQLKASFHATCSKGIAPTLNILNRKNELLHTIQANETIYIDPAPRIFKIEYCIPSGTTCQINGYCIEQIEDYRKNLLDYFSSDSIIISPGYPSVSNKYFWAFVHTRVIEYQREGLNFNIVIPSYVSTMMIKEFEGIKAYHLNFFDFRELMQKKFFKLIIVHFLTDEVAQILSSVSLSSSHVYIYGHSGDLLYRDLNTLSTRYFTKTAEINSDQMSYYRFKDKLVNRFNNKDNIKFIFGTRWAKETSENENKIAYSNYDIIPCPVDEKIFSYNPKDADKRKKIIIIRKFDNINTYGIDISVRCILELSKYPFFTDLTFSIYGDGDYHDILLAPLKQFKNVEIHKYFLSHEQMAQIFKENGIALFATRYETQGIAAAEAALSGLVVLTNNVTAVSNIFKEEWLCNPEDYKEMAKKIEFLYYHPETFQSLSFQMHEHIKSTCGYEVSTKREIAMLKKDLMTPIPAAIFPEPQPNILLTIIVPSYNVEQWLRHGIETLISSKYSDRLEILIVNDGSSDNTAQIGKQLQECTQASNGKSIVRLINKKNGGHGSTINVGISEAQGKYLKLMDADDYYDTEELDRLIPLLESENSDIVLTDYVEDWSTIPKLNSVLNYTFMEPGKQYNIEDLCFAGYGFNRYANILHTSTYKTSMMKNGNFKISEHCFYVDMEMNTYSFILAKTITYYPLQVYVYYLGRAGQSVSPRSFKKNYLQHEHVTLKIIKEIEDRHLSYAKKNCLYRTIVLPMVETQYYICTEYLDTKEPFLKFDQILKQYPEIYTHPYVANEHVTHYRATGGKGIGQKKGNSL